MGCSTSKSKKGHVSSIKFESAVGSVESIPVASKPSGLTRIWKRFKSAAHKPKGDRDPKKGRTKKTKGEGGHEKDRSPAVQHPDADAADSTESLLSSSSLVDEVEKHAAFRNVGRSTAERLLLYPNTPNGTFIVRPREERNSYALSVRFCKYNEPIVNHFMVSLNSKRREYELDGLINRSFMVHCLEDLTRNFS